ncbi:hypothetical protein [Thermomonas sp. HDW16]|uniref:hypothetical protein n=1 Tax=Thermomonas sp. HDW16 TaxID=2714945 RepID=UPI00140DCCB2|nr:hypothetical protein [Thermomonas sp. HDW16]QIL21490.1 hypothetical protein G7079_12510 [Thermomonas sp. HDW16]
MSWDGFQREVLAELGHVLYRPMHAQAARVDVDAGMLARLARAVGMDADELHAHADIAAQTMTLRGNAAAKRALWPRLRALRRDAR